jgi:hypothetical protein
VLAGEDVALGARGGSERASTSSPRSPLEQQRLAAVTLDARVLHRSDPLPASLRFDPRARQQGGPYRSGGAGEPTFHGHRFSDALRRAVTAAGGLAGKGQPLQQEMVTYARPILWLRYKLWGTRCEAVLCARADGELAGFVSG